MAEIENHTLRVLQELRDETRQGFARLEAKMNDGFEHLSDEIDGLKQLFAGESVLARFVGKGVEERFTAIEQRLAALEQAKQ
jgi:hypothetical protein